MKNIDAPEKIEKLLKVHALIGYETKRRLEEFQTSKKLPMSLLIAFAIENELLKPQPFDYDVTLSQEEYDEYAFADQAGKIYNFLKTNSGMSLEMLCSLRHDFGIESKEEFLLGFRKLMEDGMIEAYKPKTMPHSVVKYPDHFRFYRLKNQNREVINEKKREAREYEKFLKMKKKFEGK